MLRRHGHQYSWRRYHRYRAILSYMRHLAQRYPHRARVVTLGTSSEGRPLVALKMFSAFHNDTAGRHHAPKAPKPAIWIDAGSHGREWIGPAVAMYVCAQLVERADLHGGLLRAADWYVLPVLNPDGYEYSHAVDRLWRKTRSSHEAEAPPAAAPSSGRSFLHHLLPRPCRGVDLNRNWGFRWGERGASDDPCSPTYAGPRPFSEPESRAAANFIMAHRHRIQIYLTLHSYSQLWLIPSTRGLRQPPDYPDLYNKAALAVAALQGVRGTHYHIGMAHDLLYPISGTSDSWARAVAGIKYSYAVELPDRGDFGFLLPAHLIAPTGKEFFAAVKALAQAVVCQNN